MKSLRGKLVLVGLLAVGGAVLYWALQPTPMKVELVQVGAGPLVASVDEDGETRAHDRFIISAPIAGRLRRVELHDGDIVKSGQTVAIIEPSPLDPKERQEVVARVDAAEAARSEADEHVRRARSDYEQARRERERAEKLVENGLISVQAFEQARNAEIAAKSEVDAAVFRADAAASEVSVARAGLLAIETVRRDASRLVSLKSPISGRVLRVIEKSERIVASGTPIISVGDARKLEVVVDVLSTDAVTIHSGDAVLIENWGGATPIHARVRTIEPAAFTKVSALGVEEQRVNIVADFVDSPGPLGDGYRVEARIVTWQSEHVTKLPIGAVFRTGDRWSVFVVEGDVARVRIVELGHQNQSEIEVVDGVAEGEMVIAHPPSDLADGTRVEIGP